MSWHRSLVYHCNDCNTSLYTLCKCSAVCTRHASHTWITPNGTVPHNGYYHDTLTDISQQCLIAMFVSIQHNTHHVLRPTRGIYIETRSNDDNFCRGKRTEESTCFLPEFS